MCGIAGFITSKHNSDIDRVVSRMAAALQHRGPDDHGTWVDQQFGIALGHRRLSVLDLSAAGKQPMVSASGRWVIAYNGEIYNHLDLRRRLETEQSAPNWRGHSDTETILACIDAWGIESTLQSSVGMFAFALWDREEHVLVLARDRVGEKPLYYGWQGGTFLFGSELKALQAHSSFNARVDRGALSLLLRHNCVPAPYSIYEDIYKLRPGHVVRILHSSRSADGAPTSEPYWSMNDVVEDGLREPFSGSEADAIGVLEAQLMESIGSQMLSDVPLGAFLSGGIDSSTVVALMQAQSDRPVKTFTIGFDEGAYNEAAHAKSISQHLGTEHTELYVRSEDALAVIPQLSLFYCEPFGDNSQIPTFLVSQLARQHVTVALSGDGGDELFGGYNRYVTARRLWGKVQKLPKFARGAIASVLHSVSPKNWDGVINTLMPLLPNRLHMANPGDKAHKFADVLRCNDDIAYFRHLTSLWKEPTSIVSGGFEPNTLLTSPENWPEVDCLEHWMMALDTQSYLTDDILVKVDRAAMANSLETRVPMLDHRLVSLAWSMPIDLKVRDGQGKWLLRQVLNRHVPREMVERPKMGFAIPLDDWLRGPLRDWAESLLDDQRLQSEGYFNPAPIRTMWQEHLSGRKNWQHHLWTVLMFQAWLTNRE
jgi:asparagine synthase (glutamine-hydrolysing)